MQVTVTPSKISGSLFAAASKSSMQRACAAALVRSGKVVLQNPGTSADDQAALGIIKQLGARVDFVDDTVEIHSTGVHPVGDMIDCGESGLSVRMFTSIASISDRTISITGSGSLVKRPLSFFNEVLPQLDVICNSNNGYLPLQIKGPLQPKDIEVDGSLSSQYLTGLLMAYSAANASGVTIRVNNLNSKPYIDLTLDVMKAFELKVPENNDYKEFYFKKDPSGTTTSNTINYTVEGDWSGAAFLLVAGAVAGSLEVKGLDVFSTQADKAILQALTQAGAVMSVTQEHIQISNAPLKAFHFNATDCPDLFPPLVALASYCNGTTAIEGVNRLTHKESNRALTLQEEFGKMGIEITLQDDLMLVKGGTVKGAEVSSHHDHRIAMACAVAALKAEGNMEISNAEAVNKSYPQFWEHLQKLKVDLSITHN
jgi:3-phosphoshikimate 1-carboxyvinyltransferase